MSTERSEPRVDSKDNKGLIKSLFETAIDGIILINSRGEIIDVNESTLSYFGYSKAELIGQKVNILMPSHHSTRHDGYIKSYLDTGVKHIIDIGREVEGLRKDGNRFPFRLAVSEFQHSGQRYFTGIIHDLTAEKDAETKLKNYAVTLEREVKERTAEIEKTNAQLEEEIQERQHAELALKESQKLYKIIAQNFPNGTINVFDHKLNYIFVEGKGLLELGIQTEDLLGSNFIDRLDPQIQDIVKERLLKVFQGTPDVIEIALHNEIYSLTVVPLFNVFKEVGQILVVETNITQQKRAEEEMSKALQKEIDLNEMKSRFVSMASHEFRTPLSAINSSATLIGKYSLTEQNDKRLKHVNRIKNNVDNLNIILQDFLSLEKLDSGLVRINVSEFELCSFTRDCIEDTEGILKAGQKVNILADFDQVNVEFDRHIYKNILANLLSNASKYSSEGDDIDITLKEDEKGIEIMIRDYGIGIPKKEQKDLFSRFFRASNAGNINGTGLGLHIVKTYVDLVQGKVKCKSEVGKGTSIILNLPIKQKL